ncbi:MAG: glycosyltransferase family 2 protein [Methanosphaera stadtmanae]|nr:glycosyltransferase family 2 protein [Methanosphaera stadtmanae]
MVKISIVMPVYNGSKFLKRSINSVLEQTLKDLEIICVNDESTDNSLEILEELQKEHDFIKILNQKNSGSGKARNNGMNNAVGEYIAFLDVDDIFVDKDALEKMYNFGIKNDADIVGGNLVRVSNEDVIEENFNYAEKNYMYFSEECEIEPEEYGIPWAFYKNIFKRSFLNKFNIRFPNLSRGQDPVFLAEILTKVDKVYAVNSDLYGYYYNAAGQANDKINTTEKKIDYLNHYKQTFDILDKEGFTSVSNAYKNTFITILRIKERENDQEYIDLVYKIFDIDKYFEKDSYPYSYLSKIRPSEKISDEDIENLLKIKEDLVNKTLTNDFFIDFNQIKQYTKDIEEFVDKDEFIQQSYAQVYDKFNQEKRNFEEISNDLKILPEQIQELKDSNEAILSSGAWKHTKFLRDIKHYLK